MPGFLLRLWARDERDLLLLSVLLWQLAGLVKTDPGKTRPFLVVFLVAFMAIAVISKMHFFAPPFVMEIVIAACIGTALITSHAATAA